MPKVASNGGKRSKAAKDPNAPKKNLSGYFHFCAEQRATVKSEHPDYSLGDTAKALGKLWGEADAATKSRFEKIAQKDKERYEREMTAYKKGGSFSSGAAGSGGAARQGKDASKKPNGQASVVKEAESEEGSSEGEDED